MATQLEIKLADALRAGVEAFEVLRPCCKDGADFADVIDATLPDMRAALAAYDAQPRLRADLIDKAGTLETGPSIAQASDHTPEPWFAGNLDGCAPYIEGAPKDPRRPWSGETIASLYYDADDGTSVVGAIDTPFENAAANARRIVACVNACAGIATEDLEGYTARSIARALASRGGA